MHPWLHSLLDLFFPPKCIYCQAVLSSGEEGSCPTCITQLPWIEAESILLPGKQLSHQLSVPWYEMGLGMPFCAINLKVSGITPLPFLSHWQTNSLHSVRDGLT